MANAERAQSAGIEVVVLDAGWFGLPSRHSYWYQLCGDWDHRNAERFPSGLKRIGESIRNLGIEFGIWLEVEALGESSQLAQTRPDFAAQRSGQNLGYVCLANPDAREWAYSIARNLINECGATWLKMDFNVDPGAGCNRSDHGHEPVFGLSDHLHNLYQLFDLSRSTPSRTSSAARPRSTAASRSTSCARGCGRSSGGRAGETLRRPASSCRSAVVQARRRTSSTPSATPSVASAPRPWTLRSNGSAARRPREPRWSASSSARPHRWLPRCSRSGGRPGLPTSRRTRRRPTRRSLPASRCPRTGRPSCQNLRRSS